ncbi:MAG: aminoacyl-tRNA hydrolase [Deltaproteobacteria bacterium]|nr:aminoacyl-tRNA hydrolase [Deltaproteobacteria bacterium]
MKIIVGLGNPGREYVNHKHNVGFWVVDLMAKQNHWEWEEKKQRLQAWGSLDDEECWLVKPATYMNLSGQAVQAFLKKKNGLEKDLIVFHDDMDLELGKIRWAFGSGHGGHNGVRSIIDTLGTKDFHRIRLGIGRPEHGKDPADYVLQPFKGKDLEIVEAMIDRAAGSIPDFLKHGLQWVQNKYH